MCVEGVLALPNERVMKGLDPPHRGNVIHRIYLVIYHRVIRVVVNMGICHCIFRKEAWHMLL